MADQVLTAESPASGADLAQTTDESRGRSKPTAISKEDIQLWLHFDLGAVQLSLAEIEGLAPGQTLLLGRDPELPVQLKCCGQTIGEARLVQIQSQLAIQVAKLRHKREGTLP